MPGTSDAVARMEHLMELAIPYSSENHIDALVDLVTDIKLYCAATDGMDWDHIDMLSVDHYEFELLEEQVSTRLNDDYEAYVGQGDHGYRS